MKKDTLKKAKKWFLGDEYSEENARRFKRGDIFLYFFIVLLYFVANYLLRASSRSSGVVMLMNAAIPLATFSGVFSALTNFCIIFLVVYFRRPGYITSMLLMFLQFPLMIMEFIRNHNATSIPGFFSNIFIITTVVIIYKRNMTIEKYQRTEVQNLKIQQKLSLRLFEQTATALVNAIDAKDRYSHGHSLRVAEYSERIAKEAGMDEEDCRKIYYSALLHDVGKIGIDEAILNKNGRLTTEEFDVIKAHPAMGSQILQSISEYPYLSIGAHYHHERYDGRGYPNRLKGDDIPVIARIISVADAYDAMSSKRSYRDALPQQLVREEIIKGSGTQFDPKYAKIMQRIIDLDEDYELKEKVQVTELAGKDELYCGEYRSEISDGIVITQNMTQIHMKVTCNEAIKTGGIANKNRGAALVLFDSLDGRVHDDEKTACELLYYEYGEIWFDGRTVTKGARDIKSELISNRTTDSRMKPRDHSVSYDLEAVKCKDHVMIRINDGLSTLTVTVALPDSSRYVYIGLTGEQCFIDDVRIVKETDPVPLSYIPRIADEISYIDGPAGDIPNIQIDSHRTDSTQGIQIANKLTLSFHTMSLPTARLIWHCPYLIVFSSADGRVYGRDYREYALIRLDGEVIESDLQAKNVLTVNRQDNFEGWDDWKEKNKEGFDSTVFFGKNGNIVTMGTENLGVAVQNITTIPDSVKNVYIALTGDQCALTNIRITR